MRKFQAWGMIFVMAMCVFMAGGCGGGSMDENSSTDTDTDTETLNEYQDTYSTAEILTGSWNVMDREYTYTTDDSLFELRLYAVYLDFASIDLGPKTGTAIVSSRQEWQGLYNDPSADLATGLGIVSLDLDFDSTATELTHQGRDNWRCTVPVADGRRIVMNIAITSQNAINVNYQGVARNIYSGIGTTYNFSLNFRKKDESQQ